MLHQFIVWFDQLFVVWFGWVKQWGYLGVILLMAMESSIIPVPSEVVIPPAAFWAAQNQGMSFWGVIAAGTFGSWLGSAISYWLSLWLGRLVIARWGRLILLSPEKLDRSERFMHRYESGGIFFARLLPVIRHLISIPAGLMRMNFGVFSAMTVAGAFVWCTVLAWFGSRLPAYLINDPAGVKAFVIHESKPIVFAVICFCVLYFLAMRLTAPANAKE
ncbi:MAG TPA: DedA family protein [Chthoniobacteraceae bacterium]|jgi:membrane protein DedA with SNARE-associated domain